MAVLTAHQESQLSSQHCENPRPRNRRKTLSEAKTHCIDIEGASAVQDQLYAPVSASICFSTSRSTISSNDSECSSPAGSVYIPESDSPSRPQAMIRQRNADADYAIVSRFDLEQCRRDLRKTILSCNKTEFRVVSRTISCVLSGIRRLSRCELFAASVLLEPKLMLQQDKGSDLDYREEEWLRKCDPTLVETPEGDMAFRSSAMRTFLQSYNISGIDTSHRTLALICRDQMELVRQQALDAIAFNDRPSLVQAAQVLRPYVAAFGFYHLQAASLTSMIVFDVEEKASRRSRTHRHNFGRDFDKIEARTKQLSLVNEVDDWVCLDSNGAYERVP